MHKSISPSETSFKPNTVPATLRLRKGQAGFSLTEVSLAIMIIGFAFVALLGLLPNGMQIFAKTIDGANESWIYQNLNSRLQTTAWDKVSSMTGVAEALFYNSEAKLVEAGDPDAVYTVKVLMEPFKRPGANSTEIMPDTKLATVLMARVNNPKAMTEFASINDMEALRAAKKTTLTHRSFVISRMDSSFGD